MASYRPISQNSAWRSTSAASMLMSERYLEYYFLTSPFSNAIGCYQIVPSIVVAEMGLSSQDELAGLLAQLQAKGIIYRSDNFVLVTTWFHHNKWKSALQGNVKKLAQQEIEALPTALQEKWVETSLKSGVPLDGIRPLVPSFFKNQEGAPKGLAHKNETETKLKTELETTTIQQPSGSCGLSNNLFLVPLAEPHRSFFESALKDYSIVDAQLIADEAGGALEAAAKGERPQIVGLQAWLPSLIAAFNNGTLANNFAHKIAERRKIETKEAERIEAERQKVQENHQKIQASLQKTETLLQELDESQLHEFASQASEKAISKKWRSEICDSILNRKIPESPVCRNPVLLVAESWQAGHK